ncbi:MAG TPA: TVP38/TMEM64 family protein [Nitrospiria bacterium]
MGLNSPQTLKFAGLLIVAAAGILLFNFSDLGRIANPEGIEAGVKSFGPLAPLVFLLIYAIGPTFFFPSWVLTVVGGLCFGMKWGFVLTLIGATTGGTIAFFVARYLGRDFVKRFLKGRYKKMDDRVGFHGFEVVFFLRLIPLVPFDVLDYIAGVSKINWRSYILATFLGIMPGTFVYVYMGTTIKDILSWQFAVAAGLLILLGLIPFFYKRTRGKTFPGFSDE